MYPPQDIQTDIYHRLPFCPSPALIQQPSAGNALHAVTALLLPAFAGGEQKNIPCIFSKYTRDKDLFKQKKI